MQDFFIYFMSNSDIYTPFQKTTELKTAGMVKQGNLSKRNYMTRFTFFSICDSFYKNVQDRHYEEQDFKKRDGGLCVLEYYCSSRQDIKTS